MGKGPLAKLLFLMVISLCVFLNNGCIPTAMYERVVHLSEPAGGAKVFEAMMHNGSITVEGGTTNMFDLTATITIC